jgi:hypothetical protein
MGGVSGKTEKTDTFVIDDRRSLTSLLYLNA